MSTEAFEAAVEQDAALQPPVRPLGEFLDTDIDTEPILVEPGLIVRAGITATLGRGGKGKTTLNINRLLRWAAGKPLFDELPDAMTPVQPLRSLIVENEGAARYFQQSLATILSHAPEEDREAARENVWIWEDGAWSGLKLDKPNDLTLVRRALDVTQADILFIEPMRGLWRGDENSSQDMAKLLDTLSELADEYQCAILMAHHERKSGAGEDGDAMSAARGSSVLEGAAAVMERFQGVGGDSNIRELSWTKARFYGPPDPVRMKWDRDRYGYAYLPHNLDERVLAFLKSNRNSSFDVDSLRDHFEETKRTMQRACKTLVDDGSVKIARAEHGKILYRAISNDDEGLEI